MPNNQALQVFYGTLPMIAVIVGVFLHSQTLWNDILDRLRNVETMSHGMEKRLAVLSLR